MKFQALFGSVLLASAGVLSIPAQAAEDCGPLKEIATLDAARLPDSPVMTVDALLNGQTRSMIVQTGALISTLRESALDGLGLKSIANSNVVFVKGSKQTSESFAQADTFSLGAIRIARMQFEVPPDTAEKRPWAGMLASDLFSIYDMR